MIRTGKSNAAYNLSGENFQLRSAPADVCLVCMPYCDPQRPSLALGLLQTVLQDGGIETRSIYANLIFCEELGVELYERNHPQDPQLPLAEWSFAAVAFPDFQPDENHFISEIHARLGKVRLQSLEECREELRFIRHKAERFTSRLAEQILRLSPRIIGCTSSLSQRVPSLALLRKIREINPDVITLMGGADCEAVMGRATHRHFPSEDRVCQILGDKGFSDSDIEAAIRNLLDNRLLVRLDQRLLALAVEEPYLQYISREHFPWGYIKGEPRTMLGQPINFMKSYIREMAGKGLIDSRYLPADC
jgi:hypothetical protein